MNTPRLRRAWRTFDDLLRGRISGHDRWRLARLWILLQIALAALFGLALGVFSLVSRDGFELRFMLASAVKMPLLLLLTTLVTCPSLYVFGALQGLRFTAPQFTGLLLAGHTIYAGVLASFATVLAFFGLTTKSYSFMVLLTVAGCALAGFLGVVAFIRGLREGLSFAVAGGGDLPAGEARSGSGSPGAAESADEAPEAPRRLQRTSSDDGDVWKVLGWWLLLYGFVGVQMAWILRPFLGAPELPWVLFRGRDGNFIDAVLDHLGSLLQG